jgi:hypothetical protein
MHNGWKELKSEEEIMEIIKSQTLSHKSWMRIANYQNLSDKFCEEFDDKLCFYFYENIKKYGTIWIIDGVKHRTVGSAVITIINNKLIQEFWYCGEKIEVNTMKVKIK